MQAGMAAALILAASMTTAESFRLVILRDLPYGIPAFAYAPLRRIDQGHQCRAALIHPAPALKHFRLVHPAATKQSPDLATALPQMMVKHRKLPEFVLTLSVWSLAELDCAV